jgi:N-acyl homoserine lactone hydrolase
VLFLFYQVVIIKGEIAMPGIKIHVLRCGTISVAPQMIFGGGDFIRSQSAALLTPEKARLRLPVSAYLVEHPGGLMLVDTGWSREISPDGRLDMPALTARTSDFLARTYRGEVGPGETALEQLSAMGIKPSDIDCVFLTSLDPDHVEGLKALAGAKRLLVAEEEVWWSYRTNPNHCVKLFEGLPLETYYFRGYGNNGPDGRSLDLFGDGTFVSVSTPGHTKGSVVLKISSGGRFVLLCSDNGYAARSWESMDMPGLAFNKAALKKSLGWIRSESALPGCAGALASHDRDVRPGVIEL